jgi:hypothetical protein
MNLLVLLVAVLSKLPKLCQRRDPKNAKITNTDDADTNTNTNTNTQQQLNRLITNNSSSSSYTSFFNSETAPALESYERKLIQNFSRHTMGGNAQLYLERAQAAPIRWSSIHVCIPNIYSVLQFFILGAIPSVYRSMAKVHNGSYMECRYELRQFGIPVQEIPPESSRGVLTKSKSLARFLKARTAVDVFRSRGYSEPPSTKNNGDSDEAMGTSAAAAEGALKDPTEAYSDCPGTDCPESNCVVFGDRFTYKYKANVAFREYLQIKEKANSDFHPSEERAQTILEPPTPTNKNNNNTVKEALLRLNAPALDQIINELCSKGTAANTSTNDNKAKTANANTTAHAAGGAIPSEPFLLRSKGGFRFAIYERETGWYRYVDPIRSESDRIELRKKISQTMRDNRKRAMKSSKTTATHGQQQRQSEEGGRGRQQQLEQLAPTTLNASMFLGNQGISSRSRDLGNNVDSCCGISRNEFVAKRFKRNHC